MVLTVTINPLLEKRFYFNSIIAGAVNRSSRLEYKSGGKGINVSRQLNLLGINNLAILPLGGNSGKILRSVLTAEQINHTVISQKNETREALITVEESNRKITSFFPPNAVLSKSEIDEFINRLEKMILNSSIVVFSGSAPNEEAAEIFIKGIQFANQYDKISVLDTYGKHLSECIDENPTVLHNNIKETESSLGISLQRPSEKSTYLNLVYKKGVRLAFLTDGKNPVYASQYDYIHEITFPAVNEVDATGSGDAFTAGIIYGLENGVVFDDFVKTAVALGALNASSMDVCNVPLSSIEEYVSAINIKPVGKKMKSIDDSATFH